MSIKVMSEVWEYSSLSGTPLIVVLALADHANDARLCWPSIEHLAKKSRLSERHTQRVLRQLEENGHLEVAIGMGPHGCNLYKIPTVEKMQTLPALRSWGSITKQPAPSKTLTKTEDDSAPTMDYKEIARIEARHHAIDRDVNLTGEGFDDPGHEKDVTPGDIAMSPLATGGVTIVSPKPSGVLQLDTSSKKLDNSPSEARTGAKAPRAKSARGRRSISEMEGALYAAMNVDGFYASGAFHGRVQHVAKGLEENGYEPGEVRYLYSKEGPWYTTYAKRDGLPPTYPERIQQSIGALKARMVPAQGTTDWNDPKVWLKAEEFMGEKGDNHVGRG